MPSWLGRTAWSPARFRTNWIHQAYLEPQSTLAWVDPDGTLVVHSSTQGAFMARQGIAELLGLPHDRVRVQAAPIGGAFGGKLMISEPLAAAAAFTLRRPVRLVFQRSEDFAAANPAPGQLIDLELGVARDGSFCGFRGRIVGDRGGLGEMGVESISTALSTWPYRLGRARPDLDGGDHQPRVRAAPTVRRALRPRRSRSRR